MDIVHGLRRATFPVAAATGCLLAWGALTGGNGSSLLVGGPFALVAAWCACRLRGERFRRLRVAQVPGFLRYFFTQSLVAGFEVARLAARRRPDHLSGFLAYRTRLPTGGPRGLFILVANLLPGTVCVACGAEELLFHILDARAPAEQQLRELEQRVARMFAAR